MAGKLKATSNPKMWPVDLGCTRTITAPAPITNSSGMATLFQRHGRGASMTASGTNEADPISPQGIWTPRMSRESGGRSPQPGTDTQQGATGQQP
jgi:hypothetical protein